MYTFKDNVFIVWGGNFELASMLSARLRDSNTNTIVGGDSSIKANYFLGPRIIEQMNLCNRAIILAQPFYSIKADAYTFRDNLMFEWGYLMRRLPPNAISVYLIGAGRNALPADLQGTSPILVPDSKSDDSSRSSWIRAHYKGSRTDHVEFVAFDMMLNWSKWKHFIDDQLSGKEAPNPDLFRRVIINAYMPVSYSEELP